MKIAVIGAGIVGVTTAHELAADGHEVQVFERHGSVAAEASFANTGVLGCMQLPALGAGAGVWPRAPLSRLGWAWKAWRGQAGAAEREQALHRWARSSRERVTHWRTTLDLPLPLRSGYVMLVQTPAQQRHLETLASALEAAGEPTRWLSPEQARQLDAGLSPDSPLLGALLLPQVLVANARQYTHFLRAHADDIGARFFFNRLVTELTPAERPRLGSAPVRFEGQVGASAAKPRIATTDQAVFDAVVLCTANDADGLLRRLGLRLPLLARQSCAVTMPLREMEGMPDLGPRAGITDLTRQITLTRLDQRLRITSLQSFRPGRLAPPDAQVRKLFDALDAWYPGAGRVTQAQQWHGSHAHLPDGLPAVGPSGLPGVWLNLGHGRNGWSLAAGAARLLADWLKNGAGRPPEGAELVTPERWR